MATQKRIGNKGNFSARAQKYKDKIVTDLMLGHTVGAIAKRYNIASSTVVKVLDESDDLRQYREFMKSGMKTEDFIGELNRKHEKLARELERPPNVVELRQAIDPTVEITEDDIIDVPALQQVTLRAAISNQQLANQLLYRPGLSRDDLKQHAELTRMNASVIDGTSKTMLNIQVNNGTNKDTQAVKAFPIPNSEIEVEVLEIIDEEE